MASSKPKKSKHQLVKSHLTRYGSITSWKAIQSYGATRLSAIIHNLRHKEGMNIVTHNIDMVDQYENKGTYAKYQYIK
jgi:hypothetical protein